MEKTATLNLRVNPAVKRRAEDVLNRLGIPMSTAIDIYLNQISLTGGIPFAVKLPKAPLSVDAEQMSVEEIRHEIQIGFEEVEAEELQEASFAFAKFREKH